MIFKSITITILIYNSSLQIISQSQAKNRLVSQYRIRMYRKNCIIIIRDNFFRTSLFKIMERVEIFLSLKQNMKFRYIFYKKI